MKINVDYEISENDAQVITRGLQEFNTPHLGLRATKHFAVYLRDERDQIVGGILAWIRSGIKLLQIDTFWVAENLRHQDFGTKLMHAAEAEGIKHGCDHAQLETLPYQAVELYQNLGYREVGRVTKLYGDHDAIYLRKSLK